ncbi:MAG TPA: M28 family metallopeptidase [Caulobacteraceae bacterium]|nr:M28 family metallopeptidase [Caulobacteraceae bacterium]
MQRLKGLGRSAALGLGLALGVAAGAGAAAPATKAGSPWWAHIAYLAGDDLQGRLPGTPGFDRAAAYVMGKFQVSGLKPLDAAGYLRPVRLVEQEVLADRSSVALVDGEAVQPLTLGTDLNLGSRFAQPATVEAPLVFVGYGLHIPSAGYDDFAGHDLKGKILVVVNGGPGNLSGAVKSGARAAETWPAAERAGAVGLITLLTPKSMDIPWERQTLLAANPGMYLADPALQEASGPRFTATVNPAQAEKLFARSGHTYAEVLALADAARPIRGFALNLSLRATVAARTKSLTSSNIVGVLPGSDPRLAGEYVMVSAHLDHLGVGAPIRGDAVYNGAMDDASGVATVLEVARTLSAGKARPRRSILFAVFTAEEKGLLGSRAFAEGKDLPKGAVVADVNMDMPLPLWPFTRIYMPGVEESTLAADARAVGAAQGVELVPDPLPDRNVFTRTDQFSFVRTGVPAVALKFGFLLGTPEEKVERDWRAQRYHAPSDDLDQPVDIAAADRFNAYVQAFAVRLADAPGRPSWAPGSIFAPKP